MDKKSKLFLLFFLLLIVASVAFTYYRIIINRNYLIASEIDCDPYIESCFIYTCDPELEECTGDPEEDTWYYKKIVKRASNIPNCDPNNDEECVISCEVGEEDCEETLCINEEEDCSDPVEYAKENPIEEEECEEDDEECLAESEEECEEGDEECLASQEESEECEEGDEECLAQSGEDSIASESFESEECNPETEECAMDEDTKKKSE